MRHIRDYSLWLGHADDPRDRNELFRLGIAAVVDLAIEEPPSAPGREMVYCRFPVIDGADNPPWMLRTAIEMIASLLQQQTPTLVSCGGGLSRSPALAAAALVKLGRPSLPEALEYIANFGQCDVSTGLLQDIAKVIGA